MFKDIPVALLKRHKRQAELVRNTAPGHPLQAARLNKLRSIEAAIERKINVPKNAAIVSHK
jgi:hypothetical protein